MSSNKRTRMLSRVPIATVFKEPEQQRLARELDHQLDEIFAVIGQVLEAMGTEGEKIANVAQKYVMHGDTVPTDYDATKLHRNLTEADGDLHIPKLHSTSHSQGQTDPLATGVPVAIGIANAQGSGPGYALVDHVHDGSSFGGGFFQWIRNETPTGTVNGVNATFTLSKNPKTGWPLLFNNGVLQTNPESFTRSGVTITFSAGWIPQTGDVLRTWYIYDPVGATSGFFSPLPIPLMGVGA